MCVCVGGVSLNHCLHCVCVCLCLCVRTEKFVIEGLRGRQCFYWEEWGGGTDDVRGVHQSIEWREKILRENLAKFIACFACVCLFLRPSASLSSCVCLCLFLSVRMCLWVYVCVYACDHVSVHVCVCPCVWCVYQRLYNLYICVYVFVCVCWSVCYCKCLYISVGSSLILVWCIMWRCICVNG